MLSTDIHPRTFAGLKTQARNLVRTEGLKRSAALDRVASHNGFNNWRDLTRRFEPSAAGNVAYLSAYWRAADRSGRGRETLTLTLREPLEKLVNKANLRRLRHSDFRFEGPDHLVRPNDADSAERARSDILRLARTLCFMEATGLKPSLASRRVYPGGDLEKRSPGTDHDSAWYDPATREHCLIDEPYEAAKERRRTRSDWARTHGWRIEQADWPGMYNPDGGARLWVVADAKRGFPFDETLQALSALQRRTPTLVWNGVSAPYWPLWCSPGAEAAGLEPRSRFAPSPPPRAVRYGGSQTRSRNKPDASMPVRTHAAVGRRLKRILRAPGLPWRAYDRINRRRSELDNWAAFEHRELPNDRFLALYYGDTAPPWRALKEALASYIKDLQAARALLYRHYPDCVPLRAWSREAEKALQEMRVT